MARSHSSTGRNPDWNEDEIILALDAYLAAKPLDLQKGSSAVHELSRLLRQRFQQMGIKGQETLRNAAGVYMKLQNLKSNDPEYLARGKKGLAAGNRLEERVWAQFADSPADLHARALQLREFITAGVAVSDVEDDLQLLDGTLAPEGRLLVRVHKTYERSRRNRSTRIQQFQKAHNGRVFCECCGFDFSLTYGERGRGFIECHHGVPLSQLTPTQKVSLSDFRLVCANCHRMIHVSQPWLTVEELAQYISRS